MEEDVLKFPEGFLWGAATSAFQVEGHPGEITDRLSDWAVWTTMDGKISDKTTADQACEFFTRYKEDIDLCKSLNLNCFRLGLNWPALCPTEAHKDYFDEESVEYYRALLKSLKAQGMTTFVTLFHFCTPRWLADIGGWTNPKTVEAFTQYADLAAKHFGDLVDYWITHNEPLVYAYYGYVGGEWPPGHRQDYLKAFKCIRYLLEGHATAFAAIRKYQPNAQISFAMHWRPFFAHNVYNPFDQLSRYLRDYVFNEMFPLAVETGKLDFPFPISLEPTVRALSGEIPGLKGSMDYLAINYYTREFCEFNWGPPPDPFGKQSPKTEYESSEMGWEMYPEGLYYLLTEDMAQFARKTNGELRPIFITENGMAEMHPAHLDEGDWSLEDATRQRYLVSHLMALRKAITDGANVKGYMYWSLMDNFEWAHGLQPRFGLVRIAYPTQERTLRTSAKLYGDVAQANGIPSQYISLGVDRLETTGSGPRSAT